ncbi:MAG: YrbL family protein [Sulfurimonas sp.]
MEQKNHVILKDSMLIGEGRNRKCYLHPEDKDLCIKIAFEKAKRSVNRETGYFGRLQKRGKSFEMIARYFGKIQTNLGEGEVYELVCDYNGNISKNLRYYLKLGDEKYRAEVAEQVEKLRKYLAGEYILFSDLDVENILLKKLSKTECRLVVIDGIGDNNQIPFLEYFPLLGNRRSIRKWEDFRVQFLNEFSYKKSEIKKFDE